MSQPQPEPLPDDEALIGELGRLFREVDASPAPAPLLSDEQLIAEILEGGCRCGRS